MADPAWLAPFRFRRLISARDLPATPDRVCVWCGSPCTGRRTRWCSQACSDEYAIRASGSAARWRVERRDRGVCALCGLDTERLRRAIDRILRVWHLDHGLYYPWSPRAVAVRHRLAGALARLGYPPLHWTARHYTGHLWEADHVVPVVEGGGCCGLEGLRTVCLPCHRRETAALAGRRARG